MNNFYWRQSFISNFWLNKNLCMSQLGVSLKVIRFRVKEINEEKKKTMRISCCTKKYDCIYRFADGTTRKATAKEKPVLKYSGFNPRGPLEQFHRVISFVATCWRANSRLFPSFPPYDSSFLARSALLIENISPVHVQENATFRRWSRRWCCRCSRPRNSRVPYKVRG